MNRLLAITSILLLPLQAALAADGATLLFKSGQMVVVDSGYQKLVDNMSSLTGKSSPYNIVELSIHGGSFLINMSEVAVLCRDDCRSLFYAHQLDPKRAKEGARSAR